MAPSFEGFKPGQEPDQESVEKEMGPVEGPLQELLPIHFTSEQRLRFNDLLERNGLSLETLPPMSKEYTLSAVFPLLNDFFELTNLAEQEEKGKEIIEAIPQSPKV